MDSRSLQLGERWTFASFSSRYITIPTNMCGIFCSLSRTSHVSPDADVLELLQRRGPDSTSCAQYTFAGDCGETSPQQESSGSIFLNFTSTVLSLRGSRTVNQPLQSLDGSHVLCWNGEAWSIAGHPPKGNDTEAVFELLSAAASRSHDLDANTQDAADTIAKHMATIAGPYAFVFHDKHAGRVYLGRDFLGRRALLWRTNENGDLLISSVTSGSHDNAWSEIEADGIYCIDLNVASGQPDAPDQALGVPSSFAILKVPYHVATDGDDSTISGSFSAIPALTLNEQLVASPSQLTKQSPSVVRLEQLLRDSLALRVLNIPDPPTLLGAIPAKGSSTPARLAILFSGGLDCTVLARISHELLPLSEPIDLLNVAFQNPRIHKASDIDAEAFEAALESCPDRITGRVSYAELCQVCPGRQWRFVAINVPYTETVEHQDKIITLMHPHNTEMDLSIACALYFAARGTGMMCSDGSDQSVPYTTTARVLLSGLGADELFAGYTRHATAYNRHGSRDLLDELKLDIGRLGKRNLGRDDRVITNWGKEARFPFLDEKLVAWALAAPVSDKCDFGAAANTENDLSAHLESCKKVLRCLAWRLGMCKVASEKKRAIQFGARTAKMTNSKSKGTTPLS